VEWAQTFAGFGVGLLIGLTGVGGGSLMTPLLIFIFGIAPLTAVGTDLLFAAITKAGGIWRHQSLGNIHWPIVGRLLLGSLPAALLTMQWLNSVQSSAMIPVELIIHATLGLALVLTSLALIFKKQLYRMGRRTVTMSPSLKRWRNPATVATGVILGILVPISSIGAGALGAAILLFLYPSLPIRRIVGTDLAHAVPLTAIAGLGHLQLGNVDLSLLSTLLLGSLPGIYVGSHMSTVIPEHVMRTILASLLMLIGVKFMLSN
jgi:uncharacterized membrane protein YfcA